MNTQEALKSRLQGQKAAGASTAVATTQETLQGLLSNESVRRRFSDMLGQRSGAFLSSVLTTVNGSADLRACDPRTTLTAAAKAAALDLPIDQNLGFAAIIPYRDHGVAKAQFQVMTRGFVQLGMRSGQYRTMNVAEVYEGEIKSRNRITGKIEFDEGGRTSDKVVGVAAYFQLINGYEKFEYMTLEEIDAHARKFSKSYGKSGPWVDNRGGMERKTVLKRLLSRWGILSVQMQTAVQADQAVIRETADGEVLDYVDGRDSDPVEVASEPVGVAETAPPEEPPVAPPPPPATPAATPPPAAQATLTGASPF